ncbi:MAG: right-handed parallel beta-helix repeat-containing protein [Bacteroidota bacterium]
MPSLSKKCLGRYLAVLFFIFIIVQIQARATQYFVAPTGNDLNAGTMDSPFATITKAQSVMVAGDTTYVRGGLYALGATITLNKSGTAGNRLNLFAYAGERPVLDFSQMVVGPSNRGIRLQGWYWTIRGLDIKGAGDNGMQIDNGAYSVVEHCAFYENRDTGLQLSNGAAYNEIINCDSYNNADTAQGNADGFAPKLDVGTGNYFFGCRAWNNSDDGFDGYMRGADSVVTVMENCWIFSNGYLANGTASSGNGNGFKMGGMDLLTDSLRHNITLINCLAFDNRVKGFDQNNNRGSMTLLNCTGYRNGTNFSIPGPLKSGSVATITNGLVLGSAGSLAAHVVQTTNSWMPQFTVTSGDFLNIDTTGVRGPRQPDGSLPDLGFMHLAQGSPLINAGTDVGHPFNGSGPDLGCFESDFPVSVQNPHTSPLAFTLHQNYPNPFNPNTTITFSILQPAMTSLKIYDILGREMATLVHRELTPGPYEFMWDGQGHSSGTYVYRLVSGSDVQSNTMTLMK